MITIIVSEKSPKEHKSTGSSLFVAACSSCSSSVDVVKVVVRVVVVVHGQKVKTSKACHCRHDLFSFPPSTHQHYPTSLPARTVQFRIRSLTSVTVRLQQPYTPHRAAETIRVRHLRAKMEAYAEQGTNNGRIERLRP